MATITRHKSVDLPPRPVLQLLDELRRRIRWYVVLEGISMLVVWLVLAFWVGMALDYLPVLVGANEMPRQARAVILTVALVGALWVIFWYVLRRVFSTFRNTSLALLVERQFPNFRDSLVTTVELGDRDETPVERMDREAIALATATSDTGELSDEMRARTVQQATTAVRDVKLSRVFSYRPLISKLAMAILAVSSLLTFGVLGPESLAIGTQRLLLMSDAPWPRRSQIELVGFGEDGVRKIARGTDLVVRVRADANREYPPPELCSILYETNDGDRGRVNMSRDGGVRDGYQYYVFNGKPFKNVLDDIQFDVIGGDYRLRDQRLQVVLSPVVTAVQLYAELPEYTGLLPREETWAPGTQLPIGSRVTARIQTSKPLVSAMIRDVDSAEELAFDFATEPSTELVYEIDSLDGRVAVSVSMIDTDGIESLEPFLLSIGAVEDVIPTVDMQLRGIGNAITPVARLPVEGTIKDDYQLQRAWFSVRLGDSDRQFELPNAGELKEGALDLREEAAAERENPFQLNPQDRVVFSVKASDRYNLGGDTHVGSNDPVTLTVVRPDELLAILDGRELGLRRRFEQIRTEMMQSRDSLIRLRSSYRDEANETDGTDPESGNSDSGNSDSGNSDLGIDPDAALRNLNELRDRWASWAQQKSEQTISEVDGVALSFEDIREELINNRVDSTERKSRLENQIIAPLRQIADVMLPEFRSALGELRGAMAQGDAGAEQFAVNVNDLADDIVVAMDEVLDKMLALEDYAEIVNLVRQIIEQQEGILKATKEEQKAGVLDLFKPN